MLIRSYHPDDIPNGLAARWVRDATEEAGGFWAYPAPPAAAPDPREAIEARIHALAMAAWDEGADAGVVWCPDADMTKRGVVPMSQEEGLKRSREHFAEHGTVGSTAPFSVALRNLRTALSKLEPKP